MTVKYRELKTTDAVHLVMLKMKRHDAVSCTFAGNVFEKPRKYVIMRLQ
jgi:hypothetical protein